MGWIDTTTADPTEILVSGHGTEERLSITIASGAGALAKGTVIAQYNTGAASGTFGAYNDAGSNGLNTAKGILSDKVDATASGAQGNMYVHGTFYESKLTGLDSNAKTDLKGCIFLDWVPELTE